MAIYHLPLLELKAQHIGIFWDSVRSRYPICDQHPPVGLNPQVSFDSIGELFPLPRFWFHSGPGSMLIQVQRDAFMFNWRKDQDTDKYPQYETVIESFKEELAGYEKFLGTVIGKKIDVINRCELTYINVIPPNQFWQEPSDVGELFPSLSNLAKVPGTNRGLAGLNATFTYRVSTSLLVDSTVRFGRRTDTSEPVAMLEIKAHGTPEGPIGSIAAWFSAAHDATHELFVNFTSEAMQKTIWEPI